MSQNPETRIQAQAAKALSAAFLGRGFFWRNNTGKAIPIGGERPVDFGLPGSADILGVVDGRFVAVEIKTPRGRQSEKQKVFERNVAGAGGVYLIARSADEAVEGVRRQIPKAANKA